MENNGYIYIRSHSSYDNENALKLGETNNIPDRDTQYATGEIKRGYFKKVIEILPNQKYTSSYVEKLLQKEFINYHIKYDAGTEFYKNDIDEKIIPFLSATNIKFKILTREEIDNLIRAERIKKVIDLMNIIVLNKKNKKNKLRNLLQESYVINLIEELQKNKRVFLKAPTGFGKTHVYYKIIQRMKYKKILIFTPRILLNEQLTENKYSFYISDLDFTTVHFSNIENNKKDKTIKKLSESTKTLLMTCCYQSQKKLLELIKKYKLKFDCIIFDEAHCITNWTLENNINEFINNHDLCTFRLFGSATPTRDIEKKQLLYGKIIEKVKVYELIKYELLCNIETIVKKLDNKKKEYHNLSELIVNSMTKYKKKKGIIYVNDCKNAQNLYNLMKKQTKINVYIYVSKNIDVDNEDDKDIKSFECDNKSCVIICVGKIGYGYDNNFIDFICLGDQRQSETDIRQIIGRGLRWNKDVYPNKLLHLLLPLYKDEFDNYLKNEHLKKYLDYIIGECGQDIVIKCDGSGKVESEKKRMIHDGNSYDGENIPIEILNEYCTTGYNKFTDFMKFLRRNKIFNEVKYNELKNSQQWMPDIGYIQKKYPKFCFRDIYPNSMDYYWDKKTALTYFNNARNILIKNIGKDNYSDLTFDKLIKKCNIIDNKLPMIDFDLYYPCN